LRLQRRNYVTLRMLNQGEEAPVPRSPSESVLVLVLLLVLVHTLRSVDPRSMLEATVVILAA